jgi:cell wall-associated NlpC family hydrolase
MPALGIVFLLAGILAVRQVIVGRAKETPTDVKDAAVALLNGDTSGLASVMARRGSNTSAATGPVDGSGSVAALPTSGATALAAECVTLGNAAKGYALGKTGPDYYDCSGLVWRAGYVLGIYKGKRYTTATFEHVAPQFATKVSTPSAGVIVIWVAGGHMGVMTSDTDFYSARSPSKGIGTAKLADDIAYFNATPDYWMVN